MEVFHLADFFKLKSEYKKAIEDIKTISLNNQGLESCGFLLKKNSQILAIECENKSIDKQNEFEISPKDFINAKENADIIAVFHSHPKSNHWPSKLDILLCNEILYPFLIFSLKTLKFSLTCPQKHYSKNNIYTKLQEYIKLCNKSIGKR